MSKFVTVAKDNVEGVIPSAWRAILSDIVEAFRSGDFQLTDLACVNQISAQDSARIYNNIEAYGDQLASLPEETWETSVCRWMGNWWLVLVDLSTLEEGTSDLVLFTRVYEDGQSYRFEIESVHVP